MRVDGEVGVQLDATGELSEIEVEARRIFVDILEYKLLENPDPIPSLEGVDLPGIRIAGERDRIQTEIGSDVDEVLAAMSLHQFLQQNNAFLFK